MLSAALSRGELCVPSCVGIQLNNDEDFCCSKHADRPQGYRAAALFNTSRVY